MSSMLARISIYRVSKKLLGRIVKTMSTVPEEVGTNVGDAPQVKKAPKDKKKKKAGASETGHPVELSPWPDYIQSRIEMFEKLKSEYNDEISAKEKTPIKVTLPDGKEVDAQAWLTTPYMVAQGISQGLADNTVIGKVNGVLWDLDRPLEENCSLQLLKFDDDEGQQVFWHSSAHMLGEAMERHYGGCLCYGPPIETGFFYDMYLEGRQVSSNDFPNLMQVVKKIQKDKQPFERLEMKKEDLLKMFEYNQFKVRILNEKVTTPTTTVYRCGPLIDLCRGPHVRHTGKVKALEVVKNSATYWEGKADAESLQRIYGISFPDTKQLKEWKHFQEEAAKRDHRKIGRDQELYFFHELSPGSCFFHPKGAHIYNTLINYIKVSQNLCILINYFTSTVLNQSHVSCVCSFSPLRVTVMKCSHFFQSCSLIFDTRPRSWRELPYRMADFGVLHRNELSGALTGLVRVRRFQQDDAHIFCMSEQIVDEMKGCLNFLKSVYDTFGFTFTLVLSTRPEKFLGEISVWDNAEKNQILVVYWQIQFTTHDGTEKRPVIIHRAILGSVERMIAILTESYGGKWPFWLSPRQAMVVPVGPTVHDFAEEVKDEIYKAGFLCDVDVDPGDTMNKKIRNAQLAQYNFILVVGEKEKTNKTVNVRTRDNKVHGEHSVSAIIDRFHHLRDNKQLDSEESF
uniref:threonine--tRNA ligase n=1 Tax=Saccoglossus kowalevskii TaxID=10224 RepID=A0ABM0LUG7_SACKO|nr:PREDICTED: threonine--tRNA ligase, cytoplasmic-like [Saccoglossus kowalevskii]